MAPLDPSKDLSFNLANQMGFAGSEGFTEVIRLYNSLHSTLYLRLLAVYHRRELTLTSDHS